MTRPGAGMAADIDEQPAGYDRLLSAEHAAIARVAAMIAERRPRHVVFTARGTSDHAALYAAYLTEIRLGLPAGLASPSAITVFGARPDLSDALVVGVSQSGGSPDLAEVLRVARLRRAHPRRHQQPGLPAGATAELSVDIAAGHERAVAATKTYTAELLALLMLVEGSAPATACCRPRSGRPRPPARAGRTHAGRDDTGPARPRYRFAAQLVTTGRGYAYPTRPGGGAC